jgi:hypothetical protein
MFVPRFQARIWKTLSQHCILILHCFGCTYTPCSGDADHRVRVSRFPHTFDIVSVCLGHDKFIAALLPLGTHNAHAVRVFSCFSLCFFLSLDPWSLCGSH